MFVLFLLFLPFLSLRILEWELTGPSNPPSARSCGKASYDNRFGRNGLAILAGLDLAAWDAVARSLKLSLAELIGARN